MRDAAGRSEWVLRDACVADVAGLARIWHEGWHDAHAAILPPDLRRLRTREDFAERLRTLLPQTRIAEGTAGPMGFCITRANELYQLYVASAGRGAGVGAALLADAEERMMQSGAENAWLACAIGNRPAERFYSKHGWQRTRPVVIETDTSEGPFELVVWRYEKALQTA